MKRIFRLAIILIWMTIIHAQTYKIVDTGQNLCYNNSSEISAPALGEAFYGQDAQFAGNQPSYTISVDSLTVYDNVTGLTWIRKPDTDGDGDLDTYDQLSWSEFQAYPETLNTKSFGGYSDWRVPTIKELYSLINFQGTDPSGLISGDLIPFIDTTYFDFVYGDESAGERLIDAQYWSNNVYTGLVFVNQIAVFGVNFADGRIKGYPRDPIGPNQSVHYARYVRGNTAYGINDFQNNGNGTITDKASGLMWSQDDFGDGATTGPRSGMTWGEALAFVQQKNSENYLGYNNWRLPNAKEMESIIDYSRSPDATNSGAIDTVFNITQITNENGEVDYPWFWTGTTHIKNNGMGDAGAYVCFGRAMGYMNNVWIDVHGAGCQRSDRKGGDFSGYTYVSDGYYFDMAPQGDAVRMYNYVRLVRDAEQGTGINDNKSGNLPCDFVLKQNFPNPFNPTTTISYIIGAHHDVSVLVDLSIYNTLGQKVCTLISVNQNAGEHTVKWNASAFASGVYFYRIQAGDFVQTKRMLLIK